MTGKRTRYSAESKARVALEALLGELTTAQLATKHCIHQTMVGEWKRQAMEGMAAVSSGKTAAQESARAGEADVEKLHAKIGQLLVERIFWPRRPVDEPGAAAPADRAGPSGSVDRAPVCADRCQPVRVLPSACR